MKWVLIREHQIRMRIFINAVPNFFRMVRERHIAIDEKEFDIRNENDPYMLRH